MTWSLSTPIRRLLAVTILVTVLLGVWSICVSPALHFVSDLRSEIEALTFERQHLWEIEGRQVALHQTEAALRTQLAAQVAVWSGPSPAIIAANIQNILRQAVSMGGGQVRSASVIGEGAENGQRKISVRFQVEGSLETLQQLLLTIEQTHPSLLIDDLSIAAPTWQSSQQKPSLTVGVTVSGYVDVRAP
jgi:hypothetical protein